MIVITGTGRSGTSVTAKIFDAAGISVGVPSKLQWYENINAGWEDPLVVKINKHFIRNDAGSHKYNSDASMVAGPLIKEVTAAYKAVKDPRFVFTLEAWLQAGAAIDAVVICVRDYKEVYRSVKESNAGIEGGKEMSDEKLWDEFTKRLGRIFYWCNIHGIPYYVIRYEHYVEDFPYELGIDKKIVTDLFNDKTKGISGIRSEDATGSNQSNE